ncbi:MAG TPA: 16S rRNA (guanine(966)-N(2))-methyltransferase RsmD [Gemmatimonadaceae bacterium]
MRIIAGEWRGRQIAAPKGDAVRPTLDRVREAWMSMVHTSLPGARVLDLFSGSGALGLEALSRGAASVDFVESDPKAFRVLRENIEGLGAGDRCVVHREDALAFLAALLEARPQMADDRGGYDVAFADPPYRKGIAVELAERWLKRPFAAIFGVEHESSETMPEGGDTRRYGDSSVTIYRT